MIIPLTVITNAENARQKVFVSVMSNSSSDIVVQSKIKIKITVEHRPVFPMESARGGITQF